MPDRSPDQRRWRVLLGLEPDDTLLATGMQPHHVSGLTWGYEHRVFVERRQAAVEMKRRMDSLRLALAPRLGLDPWTVGLDVPLEYADVSSRTGDVITGVRQTRLREPGDPDGVPTLRPVRLILPDGWHPEGKVMLLGLIREYLGGEWSAKWHLTTHPHYADFSRDRQKPAPPATVAWKRSDDFYMVHIGHDGVEDVFIPLKTDAPHWGVSAGSGKGKTTTLLSPLQHARSHGALVDIIDLKEDSFDKAAATRKKNRFNVDVFENVSGVRVHRDVRSAVSALAEFYVSIKSMRLAREAGYDMSTVPPRFLILDEFGSFVQSADSWWKFGLEKKGETPFRSWFHQILMQGRSKDHRVVVGTHDYQRTTFGNTGVRDLIGTKALIRDTSPPAFMMAFGQTTRRVKINENHPGRALLQLGVGTPVREVQLAYTSEEDCLTNLQGYPQAPEWFDQGEIAPWITMESIARSHEEMFVEPFLPGGEFSASGAAVSPSHLPGGPPTQSDHPETGLQLVRTPEEESRLVGRQLVGLREALDRGFLDHMIREARYRNSTDSPERLVEKSLALLRKARKEREDSGFPESRGQRGQELLYLVHDLQEWEAGRSNRMRFNDGDLGEAAQ